MKKKKKIFISYSSVDDKISNEWITNFQKKFIEEIDSLSFEYQYELFFAPETIRIGDDWRKKYLSYINNELDIMISFISPNYFKSEYCVEEITKFFDVSKENQEMKIIPIYFNGACEFNKLNTLNIIENKDLLEKILSINALDWRRLRFKTIDDGETQIEINKLAVEINVANKDTQNNDTIFEFNVLQKEMKNNGLLVSAKNDDIYVKQENRYTQTFLDIVNETTKSFKNTKDIIVLELDYRKNESLIRHIELYQKSKINVSHVFVLCANKEELKKIEEATIKKVTPFVIPDKFSVEGLINIWKDNGFPLPDIVFSDKNYRWFEDPILDLIKIRKNLLSEFGCVVFRGFDDGSKICYPDKNDVMSDVIKKTISLPNVSDRLNGRKMYTNFKLAGYSDIIVKYVINDTVNMSVDERVSLYEESFDFRKNYYKNDEIEYKKIQEKLVELRNMFCDKNFYYSETNYYVSAIKKER